MDKVQKHNLFEAAVLRFSSISDHPQSSGTGILSMVLHSHW